MTKQIEAKQYGQFLAAIYIPSRYQDGQMIPEDLIAQQENNIREFLSRRFGGATGADHAHGSFEHGDGRIIDEIIRRIWVGLSEDALKDEKAKQDIFKQAYLLAVKFDQEAIAVEWLGEIWGIKQSKKQKTKRLPFSSFASRYQDEMVTLALRRIQKLEDMASLLSLNGWKMSHPACSCWKTKLRRLCEYGKRQAFITPEKTDSQKRQKLSASLNENDLLFDQETESDIRVWLKYDNRLTGGRKIGMVDDSGRIPRQSIILALSLLESKREARLEKVLDRSILTKQFFKEYSALKFNAAAIFRDQGLDDDHAQREAQLLLGRVMLLRFLEEKGWMVVEKKEKIESRKDFLAENFRGCAGDYYKKFLEPLFFEILDVPDNKRRKKAPLPFLNGGLFKKTYAKQISLPNELFDPDRVDSILGVFSRYEFTLDETAGSRDRVSIDPSMFGHVLESLCAQAEKKNKGVHYTPPEIAGTLAFESIVARLSDIADIDVKIIRRFALGASSALNDDQIEKIGNVIHEIRVIDPAVGSGALLLAALNEMMRIKQRCADCLGQPIQPGKHVWAKNVRRFVRESLFGVDIDANAVEVAKLRLWLAITVGDDKARPLPDLGHNIRTGDSLSEVRKPEKDIIEQSRLEFSRVDKLRNEYLKRLKAYQKAEGEVAREAAGYLEAAEREFVVESLRVKGDKKAKIRAQAVEKGGATPFFWDIHFFDVFNRKQDGFDIVIANPPYVRIQNLRYGFEDSFEEYKTRFTSMEKGASDLYLAFVEQALRLAGRAGQIAFIMPNFSRTATGEPLREILKSTGAVERWVDYSDIQVFETASNYVALLFATSKKRKRKTFQCIKPAAENWPPDTEIYWFDKFPKGTVNYGNIWRTFTSKEKKLVEQIEANSIPLGELVSDKIGVGVQTSADDVFLLKDVRVENKNTVSAYSTYLKKRINLEKNVLKLCAKGSLHLQPYHAKKEMFFVWPYKHDHELLDQDTLEQSFPLTWGYFQKCGKRLKGREKGKFNGPNWWRFGRDQGRKNSCNPKLLIPSTMNHATAVYDEKGEIAYTASGKGGGGAYGIFIDDLDKRVEPYWLLAVLNSDVLWKWIQLEGDPKKGGWRGVDKALISRLPIPIALEEIQKNAKSMSIGIEDMVANKKMIQHHKEKLDPFIKNAYSL